MNVVITVNHNTPVYIAFLYCYKYCEEIIVSQNNENNFSITKNMIDAAFKSIKINSSSLYLLCLNKMYTQQLYIISDKFIA